MTPKQILDSFSETLMQDERILSAPERALLSTVLQHARAPKGASRQTQDAVKAVVASAVGETVAQRAFAVLGGSIVEHILADTSLPSMGSTAGRPVETLGDPSDPQSPGAPEPGGPGVRAPQREPRPEPKPEPMGSPGDPSDPGAPEPGGPGVRAPKREPKPEPKPEPMGSPGDPAPGAPEPGGPGARAPKKESTVGAFTSTEIAGTSVAVADRPQSLPAQSVILDEFLAPPELDELIRYTLDHEPDFKASEVVSPHADHGVVNYRQRRSHVLMEPGPYQEIIRERIQSVLPQVLEKLGMEPFPIASLEVQITASNDGDYFHFHSDNGSAKVALRTLTFVYFFHREPRAFEGGELRIHDARLENGRYVSEGSYQTIVPRQNQIVFFPCQLMHEVTAVNCASGQFADSRFTLNGWLRR
jgi:Rps23 Pro-64 3,4-dihydroxylase Tpa1-like proline 4-hydroxylase